MAQKYKCNRCGSIFSADGQGDVRCPQCGTEDIVVVTDGSSNKKIIIAVLIFIILAAGGLVAYKLLSDNDAATGSPEPKDLNNVEFTDMGESMPVTIDTDSASYTFKVFAILSEQISEPVYYSISLADGTVKTSNDGLFRNVPPSREYTYIVRANVKGRDDIKEATLEVTGFYPIEKSDVENPDISDDTTKAPGEPVKPRVTVQQVQQWVDNLLSEGSGSMLVKTRGNNLVQQPVHWAFTNLRSGESKPQNASVVMEKLDSEWTSLTVVSITTSPSNGMLTSLTCKINYREE